MSPTACYDDSLASKRAVTCRSSRISQNTSPVISTHNTSPRLPLFRCLSFVCVQYDVITGHSTIHRQSLMEVNPGVKTTARLGRGLTETGTNSDFCPPAELWERRWCPTPLVTPGYLWCLVPWNSSPWLMFIGVFLFLHGEDVSLHDEEFQQTTHQR